MTFMTEAVVPERYGGFSDSGAEGPLDAFFFMIASFFEVC